MNYDRMIVTCLSLAVIVFALLIIGPVLEENRETKVAGTNPQGLAEGQTQELPPAVSVELVPEKAITFDLKYDKYLVPAPYTYEVDGETRFFAFLKMIEALSKADAAYREGNITYIDNYKNQNGMPPRYKGQSKDAAGSNRSASAPGYPDPSDQSEFTYLSDGTLVRVLEEKPDYTKVIVVDDGKQYFVPSKYVRTEFYLTALNKAIVVDRANQNIAAFEKRLYGGKMGWPKKERWTIVSYNLATTGMVGKYHQPTPLGYYYAIERRERFYYLKDGTNIVEGYAPYAVRFNAGAYIHGVSTAYTYKADGTRVDPGIHEFSDSIGTIPLSHKCVRNYTSHAKFIYDWYVHGETIVVVIE